MYKQIIARARPINSLGYSLGLIWVMFVTYHAIAFAVSPVDVPHKLAAFLTYMLIATFPVGWLIGIPFFLLLGLMGYFFGVAIESLFAEIGALLIILFCGWVQWALIVPMVLKRIFVNRPYKH